MLPDQAVLVYGAYGHTGRFVVSELRTRGLVPVLAGREPLKLRALQSAHPDLEIRSASVDDAGSLVRALEGVAAVINCAGPFMRTAGPVLEAALTARVPYLDIAAEIEVPLATFERYTKPALETGIVVTPSMAFYGGLGDLLATAAMGDWPSADRIDVAYALSSWKPTLGTRATTEAWREIRGGRRRVYSNHQIEFRAGRAPTLDWTFPPPFGTREVVSEFTTADLATISRHVETPEIRQFMTTAALRDLDDPDLSPPPATDSSGRSDQTFLVEVVVRLGKAERRAVATGRDIYAISAPLVVEATERVLNGSVRNVGVLAPGQAFDAREFLGVLSQQLLTVDIQSSVDIGKASKARHPSNSTHRKGSRMTTVTPTTSGIVDAFFNAFGSGDIPGLAALFADDADFFVAGSPTVPWVGRHAGKAGFEAFFASFGELLSAPEEFVIATRVTEGTDAVVIGRCAFGVLATGKKFDNRFAMHFSVKDGKIVKYHMYEDSYAIHESFTK